MRHRHRPALTRAEQTFLSHHAKTPHDQRTRTTTITNEEKHRSKGSNICRDTTIQTDPLKINTDQIPRDLHQHTLSDDGRRTIGTWIGRGRHYSYQGASPSPHNPNQDADLNKNESGIPPAVEGPGSFAPPRPI